MNHTLEIYKRVTNINADDKDMYYIDYEICINGRWFRLDDMEIMPLVNPPLEFYAEDFTRHDLPDGTIRWVGHGPDYDAFDEVYLEEIHPMDGIINQDLKVYNLAMNDNPLSIHFYDTCGITSIAYQHWMLAVGTSGNYVTINYSGGLDSIGYTFDLDHARLLYKFALIIDRIRN